MTANDIIRAWTDPEFRSNLEAQGIEIPANPADDSLLTDADLDSVKGGMNMRMRVYLAAVYGMLAGGNTVLTTSP